MATPEIQDETNIPLAPPQSRDTFSERWIPPGIPAEQQRDWGTSYTPPPAVPAGVGARPDPAAEAQRIAQERLRQDEETARRVRERNEEAIRLSRVPTPQPSLPQFRNIPDPDRTALRSGFEAFKSPAIFLALMGSLASRRPLVGAMQAATGVIEGFQQGDKEKVERQRQIWKDQVEAATKQNDIELNKYNAVLSNVKLTAADKVARINALGAAARDEISLAQLRDGGYGNLAQLYNDRAKANEQLKQALARVQGQRRIDQAIINELTNYPGMSAEDLGFIPVAAQTQLKGAFVSADHIEKIAQFVKENPTSIGIIADAQRRMNFDAYRSLASPKGEAAPGAAERVGADLDKAIDASAKAKGLDLNTAAAAKVLGKMLTTQAFADAASAGARGATVYLDKAFKEIYQQASSPEAFFSILEKRYDESAKTASMYKMPFDDRAKQTPMPFWQGKAAGAVRDYRAATDPASKPPVVVSSPDELKKLSKGQRYIRADDPKREIYIRGN